MSFRFTVVETSLNRAEFRWKWLKFLQHSFLLGVILCLLVLLFGAAIILGWVTSKRGDDFLRVAGHGWLYRVGCHHHQRAGGCAGAPLAGGSAGAGEPAVAGPVEHAALSRTTPAGCPHDLVCHAHRPASPRGPVCQSGADAFPRDPRDGVYVRVPCGADGHCRDVPALLALDPVAGGGEGQGDPACPGGEAAGPDLAHDQQRRAEPGLGRSPHHRPGRRPAGDEGGCGAAANRGGGQSGPEEGGLVFDHQRRRRDAA